MTANLQQAAAYSIVVDGAELSQDHHDRLKEIRVVDDVRLPDVCTIEISYPEGDGVDSQPFEIGKALEVRLGAAAERMPQTLFKGEIVTLQATFGTGGCGVTVRAYDRSHVLHRARHVRTFQNQTTSDIVKKVVVEAGLTARCDASGEPHEFVQQDNETDWDFILRLADRAGLEFVVRDQVAELRRPTIAGAVDLHWPDTLRSFSPRVTAVQQVQEVTLRAQNPQTKQAIEASVSRPEQIAQIGLKRDSVAVFDDATIHVATEPVQTQGEATALAQALLDKLANGYIAADGIAPGNPRIRAGVTVNVAGVGTKFSGTYRVAHSIHVLRVGAYETRFANSATHTVTGVVGGADRAPIFGAHLVLGIVTNNNDPEGLGRVRVQFPALGDELESAWARIASASAGDARGLLMLPVVGEEVLVGFEHQDTRRPYVLGSLFNGKDKPGDDLLQDKDGSFALHSDHKILIESAEDQTVHSAGRLIVNADGNVEETFGADWTNDTSGAASLKGGRSFAIDGQQVTISATTMLELSCGGASIKLSSAGVQISGTMITIG